MAKKVVIDPGHGGSDPGAQGPIGNEKDYTLMIAKEVESCLKAEGISTTMTRSTDVYITPSKRIEMANNMNADAFISIHLNSNEGTPGTGFEVLYDARKDTVYPKYILNNFASNKNMFTRNRGTVNRTNLKVLNGATVPSCLIEVGFINNSNDGALVKKYYKEMGRKIADGIINYFNDLDAGSIQKFNPGSGADAAAGGTPDNNGDPEGQVPIEGNPGLSSLSSPLFVKGYGATNKRQTTNPLVPFHKPTAVPPSYYDDDLPSHRDTQVEYFLRLGDCQFFIPPAYINVTDATRVESIPTLRQRESTKTGSGYSNRTIEMSIWFNGVEQINGTPIVGPGGGTFTGSKSSTESSGTQEHSHGGGSMSFDTGEKTFTSQTPTHGHGGGSISLDTGEKTFVSDGKKETSAVGEETQMFYMDGLRPLIAQFKKTPFVPVVNELLNEVHKIHAVTLLNMDFVTLPEMPGCVQAKLTFKEFNATPMTGLPSVCLDSMYCWPLFRWFYQQPICDGQSLSKFRMPKICTENLTGSLKFKLLPETILMNADNKYANNRYSQYEYIYNEWAFMEEVEMPYDDVSITSITASMGQIVTDLQLANHKCATHQFLGSIDTMMTVTMRTESREFVSKLSELHATVQSYSRKYKNKITTGYLGVENEFMNMFGVETVCVTGLEIRTVEGFPGLYDIVMSFISYDKTQYEQEKPNGMAPHNLIDESNLMIGRESSSYRTPIVIDGVIEDLMKDIELYPDLQLPSYEVANHVIKTINAWRTSKGFKDLGIEFLKSPADKDPYSKTGFVDPDFYIFYPSPAQLNILSSEDLEAFYLSYRSSDSTTGMLDKRLKFGDGDVLQTNVYQLLRDCKELGTDFLMAASLAERPETQDIPGIEDKEYYKLMFHDMIKYSARYTMARAFPTCLVLFVDEGMKVRGTRFWSNFYSYHAIMEVSTYSDKDSPITTCKMTLANVYYSLSTKPSYTEPKKKNIFETFFLNIDDEMVKARQTMYNFMNIESGCRVHIRMGYGSYGPELPIVFNGVIAEIDPSDTMTIIAQSDGHELTNAIVNMGEDDHNGIFKFGNEPSNVIRTIMTDREKWYAAYNWIYGTPLGDSANDSKFGIEHFGYTYYKEGGGIHLKALFSIGDEDRFSYDVIKNVYKGLPFVNSSGKLRRTTLIYKKGTLTDEYNKYFYLYGKTPWDVFLNLAYANTEYIVGIAPHGFRSTLFFGQPTWLYKYGYLYTGGNSEADRLEINNYYEKVKTFAQAHCINSLMDIIDNSTRASSDGLCTAVIPVYTEGNSTKSDICIYADRNIYPEYQKTEYYDTTAMQDYFLPEFIYTCFGNTPSQDTALAMGRSYLQHSFKNMYRGNIIILGDATIKPHDVIFLNDSYRNMYGPCYVGSVVHSMSISDGYITSIKPDLISTTHLDSSVAHGRMLAMANIFAFNYDLATTSLTAATSMVKSVQMFKTMNLKGDEAGSGKNLALDAGGALAFGALAVFTGGGALIVAGAAVIGWNIFDRVNEWYQRVFKGKDGHTLALMPLIIDDRPLIAGCSGYQTLIPGYAEIGNVAQVMQDEAIDAATFKAIIEQMQNDISSVQTGCAARRSTGVDILNLDMASTEFDDAELQVLGATNDKRLFVTAAGAEQLQGSIYSGSPYGSGVDVNGMYINGGDTTARNKIVEYAKSALGKDYASGGNGPSKYDCSGLSSQAYKAAGITIKRTANDQWHDSCTEISKADLLPGDLVFENFSGSKCGHVLVYIGNGKTIAAADYGIGVIEENLRSGQKYGRVKELAKLDAKADTSSSSSGSKAVGCPKTTTTSSKSESGVSKKTLSKWQNAKHSNTPLLTPEKVKQNALNEVYPPIPPRTKVSNTKAGQIDGKDYVYKIPSAVCTAYNNTGGTASGKSARADGTFCAAHGMPTGTMVYIPGLKSVNKTGVFELADTGGPYCDFDINTTVPIGKVLADAYILKWGTGSTTYTFPEAMAEQHVKNKWYKDQNDLSDAYFQYWGKFKTENFNVSL